jgi:hypothetical protein
MHGLSELIVACRIVYLPYLIGLSIATMHYEVMVAHVRSGTLTRLGHGACACACAWSIQVPVDLKEIAQIAQIASRKVQNGRLYINSEGMCSQVIPVTLFVKWNKQTGDILTVEYKSFSCLRHKVMQVPKSP